MFRNTLEPPNLFGGHQRTSADRIWRRDRHLALRREIKYKKSGLWSSLFRRGGKSTRHAHESPQCMAQALENSLHLHPGGSTSSRYGSRPGSVRCRREARQKVEALRCMKEFCGSDVDVMVTTIQKIERARRTPVPDFVEISPSRWRAGPDVRPWATTGRI